MAFSQNTVRQCDFKVPLTDCVSHTLLTATPKKFQLCHNFQWGSFNVKGFTQSTVGQAFKFFVIEDQIIEISVMKCTQDTLQLAVSIR